MKKSWLFLTALFVSISATASIDALNFASPEQEKDYHQLTPELRCPQCQNNNIADSNATIAVDMRGKVFELLQEGKKRSEVVDYKMCIRDRVEYPLIFHKLLFLRLRLCFLLINFN